MIRFDVHFFLATFFCTNSGEQYSINPFVRVFATKSHHFSRNDIFVTEKMVYDIKELNLVTDNSY